MAEGLERPAVHARWVRGAAVLVAAAQMVLAYRAAIGFADDFWATTAIAWPAALYVVGQGRAARADTGIAWRIAGSILALGTLVVMAATPHYRAFYRIMPLVAGAGLGVAASGPAPDKRLGGALALLALPVLNPVPLPLRDLVSPSLIYATAHGSMLILRLAGSSVALDGATLTTPGGAVNIMERCSGIMGMSRLWVVAALVVALFPTTARQKILLFVSAAAVGLLMNVGHIAMMAGALVRRDDASFDYWHQGSGATLFAVGSMGVACLCWWLVTRRLST